MEDIKKVTIQHFDAQAEGYDKGADGKFSAGTYKEILRRMEAAKMKCVLDIGCGNGNILIALAKLYRDISLFGLDLSANMIEEAHKKLGDSALLKVGDAKNLPFQDGSMDSIICNMSFHHYPHPKLVLNEMYRVLKPEGILLIGDPNPPLLMRKFINATSKYTSSGDYKMYSRREFEALLKACGWQMRGWVKPNALSCVFEGKKYRETIKQLL